MSDGTESAPKDVQAIEIVEDLTNRGPCDVGFLRLKRFRMRNLYTDGTRSQPYPCDIVSRPDPDAVAVAVYALGARGEGEERQVFVVLRSTVRPPVYFRREKALVQPDTVLRSMLLETVAGILEQADRGPGGIERRAAHECLEEAGVRVQPTAIEPLGDELFTTPGISDEKVHFRAAAADLARLAAPAGDGSVMEEAGGVVVMPLDDAITACRDGRMPNMVTEIALVRLAERLGYVPQLRRFVADLPDDLRGEWRPLGVPPAPP